jgi:hypothetical protein
MPSRRMVKARMKKIFKMFRFCRAGAVAALMFNFQTSYAVAKKPFQCDGPEVLVIGLECAVSGHGFLVSETPIPSELKRSISKAERRFSLFFGIPPTRYLVILADDPQLINNLPREIQQLPRFHWPKEAVLKTAKSIDHKKNVDDAVSLSSEAMLELNLQLLPHELGHFWLGKSFSFVKPKSGVGQYGTTAPDWFDEISAQLMEDANDAEFSLNRGVEHYQQSSTFKRKAYASSLLSFLSKEHPILSLALKSNTGGQGQSVVVISGEGNTDEISNFYTMSRFFALYLRDRSRGKPVFGSMAKAFENGLTLKDWLRQSSSEFELPADLTALNNDWKTWFFARYGK